MNGEEAVWGRRTRCDGRGRGGDADPWQTDALAVDPPACADPGSPSPLTLLYPPLGYQGAERDEGMDHKWCLAACILGVPLVDMGLLVVVVRPGIP